MDTTVETKQNVVENSISGRVSRNIKNLYLDPNNYRFADEVMNEKIALEEVLSEKIQKRTRAFIEGEKRSNIKDLIDSFKTNGFLKVDVIQLKDLGSNNYLVIEGNRRVTALKCLQDDYKAGKDIGKLSPSIFQSIPSEIVSQENEDSKNLIIMGLKHISGNKKWPAINQAQLIFDYLKDSWGDDVEYANKEEELCKSLGITKMRLRSSQRAIHLINTYKKSDYSDQFRSDMYSIFEEIIKKVNIRAWIEWDDDVYLARNVYNLERLFSWISKDEKENDDDTKEELVEREPIIKTASEIRLLDSFIKNEEALYTMERTENVAVAYQESGVDERSNIEKALDNVQKNIKVLQGYGDIFEDEDIEKLIKVEKNIGHILPNRNSINLASKNVSTFWNSGVNTHFSKIYIKSYNKYRDFRLDNFKRINIFAGKNNCGKTTLLEAIYLLCRQNDLNGFMNVSKIRRRGGEIFTDYLLDTMMDDVVLSGEFNNSSISVQLKKYIDSDADKSDMYISSFSAYGEIEDWKNEMKLHTYSRSTPVVNYEKIQHLCRSYFSSPYYSRTEDIMLLYSNAIEMKSEGKTAMSIIMDFIRAFDPSINKIEAVLKNDQPVFIVDSDTFPDKTVELSSYGEGLVRIFEVALCIACCRNGVLLIDELETAIHFSMLVRYAEFIQNMAESFNVQIFITTHSKECIDAFASSGCDLNDISAYRLAEKNNSVEAKYISGSDLKYLVDSIDFDMRGGDTVEH